MVGEAARNVLVIVDHNLRIVEKWPHSQLWYVEVRAMVKTLPRIRARPDVFQRTQSTRIICVKDCASGESLGIMISDTGQAGPTPWNDYSLIEGEVHPTRHERARRLAASISAKSCSTAI